MPLIHRSYRFNQPTIVVRYSDRIEFINTGHSLKPVSELGRTGPAQRNPILASVFRDVEIAEAKGSGIRTIRRVCEEHGCPAPEFISDRQAGTFTTILRLPVIDGQGGEVAKPAKAGSGKQDHQIAVSKVASKLATLPPELATLVASLKCRVAAKALRSGILQLCTWSALTGDELATFLKRDRYYLRNKHLTPMVKEGLLALRFPDSPNRPDQAYQMPKTKEGKRD